MTYRIRVGRAALLAAILCAAFSAASAQTGIAESERAGWETFLATAKIGDSVQLGGPEATTRPWKLTLTRDDVTRFGLWKSVDRGPEEGGPDRWRFEIAAYRLDVFLGLDMVPPTVERIFQGKKGSLQLWMEATVSLKNRMAGGPDAPAVGLEAWNRKAYLQRVFDSLIANDDRNINNILIADGDRLMILIDHSRTFRTAAPYDAALVYGAAGLLKARDGSPYLFAQLPRAFVEKLRKMDARSVKEAVLGHLDNREVRALLGRRDLVLKEVDDLIRAKGEAAVLY